MSPDNAVNRSLTLVRVVSPKGAEARRKIDRELHGLAVTLPVPKQHAQWAYDCRRKRLKTYGTVLRFLDWLIDSGATRTTVLSVPKLLMYYCLDRLDERDARGGIASDDTTPGRAA